LKKQLPATLAGIELRRQASPAYLRRRNVPAQYIAQTSHLLRKAGSILDKAQRIFRPHDQTLAALPADHLPARAGAGALLGLVDNLSCHSSAISASRHRSAIFFVFVVSPH
jgi:hypothetical protein